MSFRAGLSSALRVSRTSLKRNASCLAVIGTATVAVYTFETLVDPDTSIQHPLVLAPGPGAGLELVGLGVRTVSFLRVKVYSAAFYAERAVLDALDSLEGFRMTGEALVRRLLYASAVAVRIEQHLRDGFTRALLARQKLARARGELSEADDEALKAAFPAGSVPKGKALLLVSSNGSLQISYEGRTLGTVDDAWVACELVMAYFADKDVISPKLKDDVARGLAEVGKR